MTPSAFVQIGATRDGLDLYRTAAARRGFPAVLVETPDYLAYRAGLPNRLAFDHVLPVRTPADPVAVADALRTAGIHPRLVLAGFERYVPTAWAFGSGHVAVPTDKAGQRAAVAANAPSLGQPRFAQLTGTDIESGLAAVNYPAVVKPVNGGGGLGVYRAGDRAAARAAVARIRELRNYDDTPFPGEIIEEWVAGTEFSVQAIAVAGRPIILSFCGKVIGSEADPGRPDLLGFRELAHIASPLSDAPAGLEDHVRQAIAALGYRDGPFHMDVIRRPDGRWVFLEAGYRLSGGRVAELVHRLTGVNWGEWAFAQACGDSLPPPPRGRRESCCAHVLLSTPAHLARARRRPAVGVVVEVEEQSGTEAIAPASDQLRHGGFAGRAWVYGPDPRTVMSFVQSIHGQEVAACAG